MRASLSSGATISPVLVSTRWVAGLAIAAEPVDADLARERTEEARAAGEVEHLAVPEDPGALRPAARGQERLRAAGAEHNPMALLVAVARLEQVRVGHDDLPQRAKRHRPARAPQRVERLRGFGRHVGNGVDERRRSAGLGLRGLDQTLI